MLGHFEVGYLPVLCNHFWSDSPTICNALLYLAEVPCKGTCVDTSMLGVVPCCIKMTYPLHKNESTGLLPPDQCDQNE
jgi:hypothetical protein